MFVSSCLRDPSQHALYCVMPSPSSTEGAGGQGHALGLAPCPISAHTTGLPCFPSQDPKRIGYYYVWAPAHWWTTPVKSTTCQWSVFIFPISTVSLNALYMVDSMSLMWSFFFPSLPTARIVRTKQWCEMIPCLEDEGCDLLVNKSGWTCTQPGGRVKTTTVSPPDPLIS